MKSLFTRLLSMATLALSGAAFAQSNVTIYGVVDIAAKYETNADGNGTASKSLGPGATGGSRLGFKGSEDLGDGFKANFKLESGFNADTGTLGDPTRFFNRESWVGLSGTFGELRLGRQYTVMFENYRDFDPMYGVSNVSESVPYLAYSAGIDPVHVDNAVRYEFATGAFSVDAIGALGEVAGSTKKGLYTGVKAKYAVGPNAVGIYLEQRDPNTASTDGLSKKRTWGISGSYMVAPVILFANYQNHNSLFPIPLEVKGNLYSVGAIYPAGLWTFLAAAYRDEQKNDTGLSASRETLALSAYYNFSKRTGVYVYVDTTRWKNGYVELLADSYGTHDNRTNVLLGLRHNF